MTRTRHAVLFLGGWGLIAAVYVAVAVVLVGCAGLPTHSFVVPETAFVLTDDQALVQDCGNGFVVGCFRSYPRVVYCLRSEPSACVHEWLHAAGLDHAAIRAEGF